MGKGYGDKDLTFFSWDKLCIPKAIRGLGFRNLESFNRSLLGKQVWR